MTEYIAGKCNIGTAEIHRRYQVAIIGGILYLILALSFILADVSLALRLTIFLPAMMCSVGYIQARRKFCLAYGFLGVFNFGAKGSTHQVKDPVALAADRAYALKILSLAFLPAIVMTAVVIAL